MIKPRLLYVFWALDGVAIIAATVFAMQTLAAARRVTYDMPVARQVMEEAQKLVREMKPTPPEAARLYAYASTAYAQAYKSTNSPAQGMDAAQTVMTALYPERAKEIADDLSIRRRDDALQPFKIDKTTTTKTLVERIHQDGFDLVWDGVVPAGPGKWTQEKAAPFSPRAGEWKRWHTLSAMTVPAPPVPGSAEDRDELAKVVLATGRRDGDWTAKINFWGGVPGSDTPSGIWQNQLYTTVKDELPKTGAVREDAYAQMQMILAQSLADSFMECWKVKYTYWTARPSMRESISKGMDNPPFPGYVAGHATISQTAADVLSVMVPKHTSDWQAMAATAGESRVIAGIHFDNDVQQGFILGHQVAASIIATQHLKVTLPKKK